MRLSSAVLQAPALETFLDRLSNNDIAGAIDIGRDSGLFSADAGARLQNAIDGRQVLGGLVQSQHRTMESMGMVLTSLSESLAQQSQAAQSVKRSSDERLKFHTGLSTSIDALSHSAEESSSSVLEMVAINNEVSENIHNLSLSVQETTTAIEEMTFSSKEVSRVVTKRCG